MNNRDLARYVALVEKKRKHEDDIKDLNEKIAALETTLITNMQKGGLTKLSINGSTCWLDRKVWAGADNGNMPLLAAALKEVGLDDYVKEGVNAQTLSAWVREFDPDGTLSPEEIKAALPAPVQPTIRISEVFNLRVRKA
jgi:hypothetical protein